MIDEQAIKSFSKELQEEIEFKRQVSRDSIEPGEQVESFASIIRELMRDSDSPDFPNSMRKELQLLGVKLGIFKAHTKSQIANIITTGLGRRKYDFKLDGVYYVFESWKPLNVPEDLE